MILEYVTLVLDVQRVKEFSEWPTFPQLFVGGELLGGCDIVETLAAEGSLKGSINDMLPQI